MSHASSLFSSNQAHLLDRVIALVQTHPLEYCTALMCILLGGYTLRHLFMPSNYANIDGPRNNSILSGHLKSLFSLDVVPFHDMLQDKYGSVAKVNGMLGKENLYVSDPRFMHEVLVKGVDTNFRHPQFTYDFLQMSFGPGILATTDSVHKAQRKMLTPVFTSQHMKSLVGTIGVFETIAQRMTKSIARDVEEAAGRDIDMLYWCSATALELIGEAGLGHTFGILEGKETPYSIAIKNYFPAMARVSPLRALFPLFYNLRPVALQRKLAEWTPISYVRALKEIIDVQDDQARAILADKKAALRETPLENGEMSHDIMSVLLKTNMELEQKDRLPEEEILAQINYSASFVPEGCKANYHGVPVLTYGAGQDMDGLFLFAEKHNVTFIGGSWGTVGAAGGWVQGGGHSVLTNTYGLGADRVVQFKVVTPDGRYRTANACKNTDLFWALRGGGGGTFGVVLEATSEVVPKPVSTVSFSWSLAPTPENLRSFMTILVENSVRWSQEGWGGYVYTPVGAMMNPLLNASQAAQSLKPITDFFKNATNGAGGGAGSGGQGRWAEYSSFLPLFNTIVSGGGVRNPRNYATASRLIPKSLFDAANASDLVDAALETITRSSGTASFFLTTPFLYDVEKTQQGESSVTPAWRDAVWHALAGAKWPWDGSVNQAKAAYEKASYAIDPLRKLTPGGGAYQNEADVYEPDFTQSFWGSNYAKLLEIKNKYDPDGLLDCWHCVGWKGNKTPIASCYL
ncbi:hypothetical protein RSOLAG1IB_08503 [Rhizoctonia solani AG-1 IB]|uniref:FAD-binding PCMH-type domain-containing protein n=1 Tax=Thanatephorus cucumeris (strain AG1-IB / isolate 7/3/14) TaxID=1108050 RepID=A0A0B7FK69_THACB|nr:hypothetical protein RSOLAG1IB_08503 [Rhizoctonia solani AG-1 IB]